MVKLLPNIKLVMDMSYNEAAMEWGWFLHLSVGSHHLCHCDSLPGRHHTHPRACLRKRWGQQSELKQNPVVQLKHVLENQHAAGSNILMSATCSVWGLKQLYFARCLALVWNGEYLFCLLHWAQGLSRAGQQSSDCLFTGWWVFVVPIKE